MLCLVPELPGGREQIVVSPDKPEQVEPPELHTEHKFQQRGKEEGRERNTCKSNNGNHIVRRTVLFGGGNDTERNCNNDLEDENDPSHYERKPDSLVEFFQNRNSIEPAVAEFSAEGLPQPGEIARDDTLIHVIHGGQLGHPFLIAFRIGLHGFLPRHIFYI